MENKDITGALHHIEINVSDLAQSTKFWGWLLGMLGYKEYQFWDKGRSWKLGDTYIVLVQTREEHMPNPYHRCGTGLNHIAFHAASKQMIDNIVEQLRIKNIPLLYHDKYPHAGGKECYAVYFEDPDRVKIEITVPSKDK
ncbi:MAG TPA: VOC family protein [Candidatus Kapabacteria bacterium]|nr:VOC family protein [Candidatus Kapabacteria bacterium]